MESRAERVAKNEALFREVNERIREVARPASPGEPSDFLCECGKRECTEPIGLTLAEYEEVRSDPTRFVVAPGHVVADVEDAIASTDRYAVVGKRSPAAVRIAEEHDPRK
ncbi:MAG TPA: hypothetical protein VHF23_04065 [Gaiellaceae bacterium]|nr:hypothetical protein [Gaiellaceae bacterium]